MTLFQALKKQEQRLNDLKKTLQRELKVQSLPNDEPIDPKVSALTPPLPRKNSLTQKTHHSDHSTRTRRISSHDRSPGPTDPVMDTVDGINNSIGTQDFFLGDNSPHNQHKSSSERISFGVPNSHATISVTDSRGPAGLTGAFASHAQFRNREFETRHLEKDINFQYLKHVVMKFMLSREHEVSPFYKSVPMNQLIKYIKYCLYNHYVHLPLGVEMFFVPPILMHPFTLLNKGPSNCKENSNFHFNK
jgi:hypothetical protein